jgi:hypothetical protein
MDKPRQLLPCPNFKKLEANKDFQNYKKILVYEMQRALIGCTKLKNEELYKAQGAYDVLGFILNFEKLEANFERVKKETAEIKKQEILKNTVPEKQYVKPHRR